jgi:hypothetical protein
MGLVLTIKRFTDHAAGVKIAEAKPAPVSAAHITNLLHVQQRDPILISRPHSARGPPVTIYEPTFAHFRHNVKSRTELEIPPDYYRIVIAFLVSSCDLYASECERRDALRPILKELLGRDIISGISSEHGCDSDGICMTKVELGGMGMFALLMLWELKNEIGTGECDPSVQASFSFTRWWSENYVSSRNYPYHTGADAGLAPTWMVYTGPLCELPPFDRWPLGVSTRGYLT